MSKWQDAGFPDRVRLSPPLAVANALYEAIVERMAAGMSGAVITPSRFAPLNSTLNQFYHDVDACLIDECNFWTVPGKARDFSGTFPDFGTFDREKLSEAIGEELIMGMDKLSPRFFADWALQRYKILNQFYIRRREDLLSETGRSRTQTSYRSFSDALEKLTASNWDSSWKSRYGAVSGARAYDGSPTGSSSSWVAQQNVVARSGAVKARISQNVEIWGRAGRCLPIDGSSEEDRKDLYTSPVRTYQLVGASGYIATTRMIFDAFGSDMEFGTWIQLGQYLIGKDENRELSAFDIENVDITLPTDPGTPDVGNNETSIEEYRGFTMEQVYTVYDYSPGFEYLDKEDSQP